MKNREIEQPATEGPSASGHNSRNPRLNRRQFVGTMSAAAMGLLVEGRAKQAHAQAAAQRAVFLVSNFHPASCGWLTTFSRERVYCANSYLDHLDRVRDDPDYSFVMSEINNIVAIMNFQPDRVAELKQRVQEKRVELVNGFFLESTINLSGGEALVRLGVQGLRWYEQVLGVRPKYGWTIDVCGTHDQMAQICHGLGLSAMVYTRANPTGKTMYWSVSPDGSRMLTLCPGHYSEENAIFKSKEALTAEQLNALEKSIQGREAATPDGAPVLILAGSGDYSVAPVHKEYPHALLQEWKASGHARPLRFTTLSEYIDPVAAQINAGAISIPTFEGGTAYKFDAFWIENNEVKTLYRKNEQQLQAAEMLATVASLKGDHPYPAKPLSDAWTLMFLNMDRNTLWGSAGGMVFVSEQSWDVQDRFQWVETTTAQSIQAAGAVVLPDGDEVGLFNPLNWERKDPVALQLPPGMSLEGTPAEALPDGSVLSQVSMPSLSMGGWKLSNRPAVAPAPGDLPEVLETSYYLVRFNRHTGAIVSLKFKKSGAELLGGEANVIVAERPVKSEPAPADFMAPVAERAQLASSNDTAATISLAKGLVAMTVTAESKFYGGGTLRRVVRFYHNHPRIDFETELNDIPTYTVVVAKFPLAAEIAEVRRGIPYGFSHGAWPAPNEKLHGWTRGIVPAVRWTDYALAGGGGLAMFDRGLTGRELSGRTPMIFLLNAEDKYHGFPNPWLTGAGKHHCPYSIVPHEEPWEQARIPHMAWEYNQAPLCLKGRAHVKPESFLKTSDNIIVEAMRREGSYIELRFAECLGVAGTATVELALPHQNATLTNMVGVKQSALAGTQKYQIPVNPQQIVTMNFETAASVPSPEPVVAWDTFVPQQKLAALHKYEPGLKGHPPFGDGVDF